MYCQRCSEPCVCVVTSAQESSPGDPSVNNRPHGRQHGHTRRFRPSGAQRQRFRRLAQAALNADLTVSQVDTILTDLDGALTGIDATMGDMNATITTLDGALNRFVESLDNVDAIAERMVAVVARLEMVVDRVERLVGVAEIALKPIGMIESAGRGVADLIGLRR